MTLLDDLQALDLSAILDGKADISVTVNGDDLLALVGNGAVTSVLGDLGTVLQAAMDGFEHPETLIEPLLSALTAVLGEIDTDIPLGEYVEAVTTAARIVAELVGMVSGDPNRIGVGGLDIGDALERFGGAFGDHAAVVSGSLARFRALVQTVEGGLPTDPSALLGPALEIVLPFPTGTIDAVGTWAAGLTTRLDAIRIDPGLTSGMVRALGEVRLAADAGDAARLQQALTRLAQVRANTLNQLAAAMRSVASAVSAIRLDDGVGLITDLRRVLSDADDTVFELLDGWREMIAGVRASVEAIDPTTAMAEIEAILDLVENTARDVILTGIDGSVEVVKQWLRDLLREIPLRPLRTQISRAIADAAKAIADADLDAPVEFVRGLLGEVSSVLSEADPAALVQAAVGELENVISDALDQLEDALGRVTQGINDVAEQAEQVLQRAVEGLRDFREVVDEITVAIENAGVAEAAAEIAATLDELQQQVSELLANAPVPDALREAVGQLISTLESIDLDAAIGDPLREVAAQLQIPAEVATTVRDGLQAVADAVQSLVPTDVMAELESMMHDVLSEIENLDISQLTSGVTDLLDGAAEVFEGVNITELIAPVGEVFGEIVAVVDRVHPRIILRPAIDLYGQLLGSLPVPSPETITTRVGSVTSQAGESVARTAAEPARRAVSTSATTPPAGESPRGGLGPAREEQPADLRSGDIVRLIGFLPAKLREALDALGAGPAGEVLAAISGGLTTASQGLREVRDRVMMLNAAAERALDVALAPITAAQIDAQLALRGSAAFSAGGIDIDASFTLVASVGPASLQAELDGERELVGERCRLAATALSGTLAHDLDLVADLLDAVLPTGLLADVDAFLAALDPEPIAAELDALFAAIVDATPAFLTAAETELRALEARIRRLIKEFNPGELMQRYLGVLDVVREELSLLDPGRLADELGAVHAEVKAALLAYDPTVLAAELDGLIAQVAAAIRGLDPAGLMPDLSGIEAQIARVGDILPINALAGVGTQLTAVGDELRALDVQGMLDAVNSLVPEVAEEIAFLIDAVRDEIVDLLESIQFSSSGGSVSASVEVG